MRSKASQARAEIPFRGEKLGDFSAGQVFVNCLYDPAFEPFLTAYVAGVSAHGLQPRAACEFAGVPRLEKIVQLIRQCRVSLHDFSRFGDRFNVPFEFGIAFALRSVEPDGHMCFAFSSSQRRVGKALSDLLGVDLHIHRGRRKLLFSGIADVFSGGRARPTIKEMERVYQGLVKALPHLKHETGSRSVFKPRMFKEMVTLARVLSDRIVKTKA